MPRPPSLTGKDACSQEWSLRELLRMVSRPFLTHYHMYLINGFHAKKESNEENIEDVGWKKKHEEGKKLSVQKA